MLYKRIMLGLSGLLVLAACSQPSPDEDVSDQGGKAPVISTFTANQLGTGYFELGWSLSDKEKEDLKCMIQIDDGQVPGFSWIDLDEADDLVWISSMAPEEADYNGFTFPVSGPNDDGFSFPAHDLDFTPPTGIYTGENYITPCTSLDKAYLTVRKPGSYYLRLVVSDSLTPVNTTYSKNLLLKANNLKPYIAGFGAYIDGEDGPPWGSTFFPFGSDLMRSAPSNPSAAVTNSDFPLTVTFYWDISDAFEEQWKDGGWIPYGGLKAPQQYPGESNFLKCSLDLDGNNIYEVTLPGDCRSYQTDWVNFDGPFSAPVNARTGFTHTFTKPGSYNVKLRVEDRNGASQVSTVRVGIENNTPPYTSAFLNFSPYNGGNSILRSSSLGSTLPGGYDPTLKGYPEVFFWFIYDYEEATGLKCFLDPEGDGTFQISLPTCTGSMPPILQGVGALSPTDAPSPGCAPAADTFSQYVDSGTFCLGVYQYAYPKRGQYFPRLRVVDSKGLATETQLGVNPYWMSIAVGDGDGLGPFETYLGLGNSEACVPWGPFTLRTGVTPNAGSELAPLVRCDTLPAMHFLPVANLGVYRNDDTEAYTASYYRTLYQFGWPGGLSCTFDSNIFDSVPPVSVDCQDSTWNPTVTYSKAGRYTSRFTVNDGATTWSDTESVCLAYPRELSITDNQELVLSAIWSPDGRFLAVSDDYDYLTLYDARNRINLAEKDSEDVGGSDALSWSPDSKWIAVGTGDDTSGANDGIITILRATPDGSLTVVGGSDEDTTGQDSNYHDNPVNSVAFSPNGKYLASSDGDGEDDGANESEAGTIKIWRLINMANFDDNLITTITNSTDGNNGHTQEIWSVAWSPDSRYLVSGAGNRDDTVSTVVTDTDLHSSIKIWDLANPADPQIVATFGRPTGAAWAVAWSSDGRLIAAGDNVGNIHFWDVSDIRSNSIHYKGYINPGSSTAIPSPSLAFSPDNRTLVSGSYGAVGTSVWDVANINEIRWVANIVSDGSTETLTAGFSPDGKTIVTADGDNVVLWDANDLTACAAK